MTFALGLTERTLTFQLLNYFANGKRNFNLTCLILETRFFLYHITLNDSLNKVSFECC